MAETDFAALRFLPWVREGAASEIKDGGAIDVTFKLNGIDVTMPMRLLAPSAVTGIDPKQVIRVEPRPATTDFTPYNFPTIEFDRPDFLWLFTPARPDGNERVQPWICLIVVRKQPGVELRFEQGALLPILEIKSPAQPARELPDLDQSWAWAHAQIAGRSAATSPGESLSDPALNLSRLVCPRKLEPDVDYIACVTPTFAGGRDAGLGLPADGPGALNPAWLSGDRAPADVRLPVYHHWEFRTGPPVDFESLVRLLEARPLPEKAGKRDVWIGHAGLGLPQVPPEGQGAIVTMQGALRPVDAQPREWPETPRAVFQSKLREVLNAPADALDEGAADPIVAPPIYGRWHATKSRVELTGGNPPWLHELNLDPRHRAAAGLGAEVIRRDQESLMAAAWEQVGELEAANQLRRRAQVARSVSLSLHIRHFQNMSEKSLVAITAPAHSRLNAVPLADGTPPQASLTLHGQIERSTTKAPRSTMRKVLRPRGPIVRRAPRPAIATLEASSPPSSAMATVEGLAESVFADRPDLRAKVRTLSSTPEAMNIVAPRAGFVWAFTLQSEGGTWLPGHWERQRAGEVWTGYNPAYLSFQATANAHEARLPRPADVEFNTLFTLGGLASPLLVQLDPGVTIPARVNARIAHKSDALKNASEDPLAQIMAAPDFPRPMYEALRDISSDYLLPGLEHIPPNTATILETNPEFIEAFMAGLSHEMARELLWREFPTDQRGTYFRQFWAATGSAQSPQIQMIHKWKMPLGENEEPGQSETSLVLLIRGELLRRYPGTIVYAKKAVISGSRRVPGPIEKYPLFRGSLDPDVTFLGFDLSRDEARGSNNDPGWFLVLQEQPSAPRFGLDKAAGFADTIPKAAKWSDLSWGHVAANQAAFEALTHVPASGPLPDISSIPQPPAIVWGRNAAHLAYATYQQPVRIAIHAQDMIPAQANEGLR